MYTKSKTKFSRDFASAYQRIMMKYLQPDDRPQYYGSGENGLIYPRSYFERRFGMVKVLFELIFVRVVEDSSYLRLELKPDATSRFGASLLQKVASAMRYIFYESPANSLDEFLVFLSPSTRKQ